LLLWITFCDIAVTLMDDTVPSLNATSNNFANVLYFTIQLFSDPIPRLV